MVSSCSRVAAPLRAWVDDQFAWLVDVANDLESFIPPFFRDIEVVGCITYDVEAGDFLGI